MVTNGLMTDVCLLLLLSPGLIFASFRSGDSKTALFCMIIWQARLNTGRFERDTKVWEGLSCILELVSTDLLAALMLGFLIMEVQACSQA